MNDRAAPQAVLFDLDGTLIDTADDLVDALFAACAALSQPTPDRARARQRVGNGSVGLVKLAFGDQWSSRHDQAVEVLLSHYATHIAKQSALYPGLDDLLTQLDAAGVPWGIVTNKPEHLTHLLLNALGLHERTGCIVGADTLPVRKPDPAPLTFAAGILKTLPQDCVYIGDHERDMVAARAAHMRCLAASYGYIETDDDPYRWGADAVIDTSKDITSSLTALGMLTRRQEQLA
ncbi:MAG: HAD-IA family hydrolase [Pseudomonadota bacterium]